MALQGRLLGKVCKEGEKGIKEERVEKDKILQLGLSMIRTVRKHA